MCRIADDNGVVGRYAAADYEVKVTDDGHILIVRKSRRNRCASADERGVQEAARERFAEINAKNAAFWNERHRSGKLVPEGVPDGN
ncbi:hypothetical protein SBA1_1030044 [Candidatus Sulfotelmatobacter kueseliae]|uniref:Uncharacterized protein n=1 Tax=Candidatus Sulfotelmatobacter kueseliae TaxID=2042962 RepID=A0A2U3JXT9_9BACT|nr:hypothetical protein SBA1_1030044 [Candidatus Sulfotelmatobacter kueseliae]